MPVLGDVVQLHQRGVFQGVQVLHERVVLANDRVLRGGDAGLLDPAENHQAVGNLNQRPQILRARLGQAQLVHPLGALGSQDSQPQPLARRRTGGMDLDGAQVTG